MFYILFILIFLFLFISIFFIKFNILIYILLISFIIYMVLTKSIYKSIKRIYYLIPYFLAVFIIQSLNSRGEYYKVFNFYLDKIGVNFTILYFTKISTTLYLLSIFFIIIRKFKIPEGNIFDEMIRINIFMKIVKKNFFIEFNKIKSKNITFKEKINLLKRLIENVYKNSFKSYPYDIFIFRYRKINK